MLTGNMWVPERFYNWLPWFCFCLASLIFFIPAGVFGWFSAGYLVLYACWVLYRRWC